MSFDHYLESRFRLRDRHPVMFAVTVAFLFLGLTPVTVSQSVPRLEVPASAIGVGIIVESVDKNSEAEKAGIQRGDILLDWTRGDRKGPIASPFDLPYLRFEQASRGPVKIA